MNEMNESLTVETVRAWRREAQDSDCDDFLALCDDWISIHARNNRQAMWLRAAEEVLERAGSLLGGEINRRAQEAKDEREGP